MATPSGNTSALPQPTPSSLQQNPSVHSGHRGRGQAHNRHTRPSRSQHSTQTNGVEVASRPPPPTLRPISVPSPAATAPLSLGGGNAEPSMQRVNTPANRGRGTRRGRGNGPQHTVANREMAGGRTFGGQLTRAEEMDTAVGSIRPESGLRADAPNFVSANGSARVPSATTAHKSLPKRRRPSKSTAADLATRLHEDIDNRQYECAICTSEVQRNSKIWSCTTCWTVFHLHCIKQWASNSHNIDSRTVDANGERENSKTWRCPGCNLPKEQRPSAYTCWCGKEHDPRSTTGLPPHSCGQSCGKEHQLPKPCPHRCDLLCHAGPCPPCSHLGPVQSCFCGKDSSQKKCIETDYVNGWSCGQLCGDMMPCGEHTCQRECHEGLCGACEIRVDARCMCGADQKPILCCDRDDDQPTKGLHVRNDGETIEEEWVGQYRCENLCGRPFDCGKHVCHQACHPATILKPHCPRSPDVVTQCPCGKTALDQLLPQPRSSCEDEIPSCAKTCEKQLSCGHLCQQTCHTGECMPCLQKMDIQCRCKRITVQSICHQGDPEPPQCMRVCHATLNCGRHECAERCCPGERKAVERNAAKKKGRPLNSVSTRPVNDFEAEHICTRLCGRMLKCGTHTCQELCHRGPCGSCREAIFEEVACNCGRTVLQPPLPCGTKPPPCRYDCHRRKPCGHPQVQHHCHSDEEACPKCPFLVEKSCICGKKKLKNQQCWFTDVRCGQICGKQLKCGKHHCRKTCHRPGECEDANGKCDQICGTIKKTCNHPCEDTCHTPYPCKQDKPCPHTLLITCPCQTHKESVRCGASATSEGNLKKELKCDDECARLERNRKLASALDIDPATHSNDHVPYSAETLNFFTEKHKWCTEQEREFRVFAADENGKRLRFKPMQSHHRQFIHSLAEDYGLDSESMDPEPHRHVAVFKTPRFVAAPSKTLRDAWRIRQNQLREEGKEMIAHAQAKAENEAKARAAANGHFNGYLLQKPKFALTDDEVYSALASAQLNATMTAVGPDSNLNFNIHFLPSEDVGILASFHIPIGEDAERTLERALLDSKSSHARALIALHKLGTALHVVRFDDSLNVVRREDTSNGVGGGWSQVAAKGAAPRKAPVVNGLGEKSGFAVLQSGLAAKKKEEKSKTQMKKEKKKRQESVADDWETELEKEEAALARAIMGKSQLNGASGEEQQEIAVVADSVPDDKASAPAVEATEVQKEADPSVAPLTEPSQGQGLSGEDTVAIASQEQPVQ